MAKDGDHGTLAKRNLPTSPEPLSLAASPRSRIDDPDPIRSRFGGHGDGGSSPERRCSSGPLAPPASRIPAPRRGEEVVAGTRRRYPPERSPQGPLFLVVVVRVVVDLTEEVQDLLLPAMGDVLLESFIDRGFLGPVTSEPSRLFEQLIVDSQIGGHPS